MNNVLHPVFADAGNQFGVIFQRAFDKTRARVDKLATPCRQVVIDDHVFACVAETQYHMAANISGTAGHQNRHVSKNSFLAFTQRNHASSIAQGGLPQMKFCKNAKYVTNVRHAAVATDNSPSNTEMPTLLSGTHLQILSVLSTELRRLSPTPGDRLAILDVGCGDGLLIDYLGKALPQLFEGVIFDLYGFDVGDHGVQPDGYFSKTRDHLNKAFPDVDWSERLALISEYDPWPYEDGFFTATVSNQVLEHVRDHDTFFRETSRVTANEGISVHVFPSKHTLLEQHTLVPFAHRFRDAHSMRGMIRWWASLGRGRYPGHKREHPSVTPESYADRHADYLIRYTNFKKTGYFHEIAKKHQFHSSFRHTGLYLTEKLRRMRGKPSRYFAPERPGFGQRFMSWIGPYLTNATLVLRKSRSYDTPPR